MIERFRTIMTQTQATDSVTLDFGGTVVRCILINEWATTRENVPSDNFFNIRETFLI